MISSEAKRAIIEKLEEYDEVSAKLYNDLSNLVRGNIELSQNTIKDLEEMMSELHRNVNDTQSILARFRDIEKHIRALESYATEGQEVENG